MSKFNLKDYQKIGGDEHIERRLRKTHGGEPNEINEAQLEKCRATEPTQLIEKLLEKTRSGEATEVTEKRLDDVKASFDITLRNSEAFEGDINKLEEKRLLNEPVEKEKYDNASKTPKAFRWWETKTKDGFKLARKDLATKTAQLEDDDLGPSPEEVPPELEMKDPRFSDVPTDEDDPYGTGPLVNEIAPEEVQESVGDVSHEPKPMVVQKNKKFTSPDGSNIYYVAFDYDKDDYSGDINRIKRDGLTSVVLAQPTLKNLITEEDVVVDEGQEDDVEGTVYVRYVEDAASSLEDQFVEIGYNETDIGGTLTATGVISVGEGASTKNRTQIINDAIKFIEKNHKGVAVDRESLDISGLEDSGEIRYIAGVPQPEEFNIADVTEAGSGEFPIVYAAQDIKKN